MQKIFYRVETEADQSLLLILIQKNLCYVSDKQVKIKCVNLLKQNYLSPNSSPSPYYEAQYSPGFEEEQYNNGSGSNLKYKG